MVGYMKKNRLGKWSEKLSEQIKHWNKNDSSKAKEELAKVNSVRESAKNVPDEIRKRLKEIKRLGNAN